MRIALVSLDQKWEDKEGNQTECSLISQIVSEVYPNVDLIIYPELTLTGFSIANERLAEVEDNSESLAFFKKLSVKTQIDHLFGCAIRDKYNRNFNRCFYIDENSKLLAQYNKMHTFSFAGENKLFSRGDKPEIIEKNEAKIGLSICFDLRFSPLYSYYRKKCNIMINIANWPANRENHWFNLLQSRAIENQFFMIGVNRTGIDGNGLLYNQSSVIYDPLGAVVNPMFTDKQYSIYDIDLQEVQKVRSEFPFIDDLRTELYSNF